MSTLSQNRPKRLIREIRRRSLCPVLAIYVVSGWVVYEVVQPLTEDLGLPDWLPAFSFVFFLIGLPIVLATAVVRSAMDAGKRPSMSGDTATDGGL